MWTLYIYIYIAVQCPVKLKFLQVHDNLFFEPLMSTCNGRPLLLGMLMSAEH